MEASDRPGFGALLRQFRLDAGITQQELAERAALSVEAISTLERGARRRPYRETVVVLARALELSSEQGDVLLGSVGGAPHVPRRREREPEHDESFLRIVRPDTNTAPTHNLAQELTSFVGRRHELDEIAALLRDHRLVTIVGPGGVGKSRVAVQLGAALLNEWADGVWLVELASVADPALVTSTVLSVLQIPSGPGASAIALLVKRLEAKRLLLILDNCEHLIVEARNLAIEVVESCPHVRVLLTSQEALKVAGERVYRLPSLAVPPDSKRTARETAHYAAVTLFVDRAQAVDASFVMTDTNAPAVAEICRKLDGIPLAIELAAARVRVLAPGQIAQRLDERFRLLTGGDPGSIPRHQAMRALLDWSYDLLTAREQRFFESLSIFAGGCTLDSATAVCADENEDDLDVVDLVASLVAKSLLIAELAGSEQRYRLLDSSQHFAREKLAASGKRESIAQRHAAAYMDLAERLEEARDTLSDAVWLAQSEQERDNWRAALEWSLAARNDPQTGARLAAALWDLWLQSSSVMEARRWVRAGLDAIGDTDRPAIVAKLEAVESSIDRELHWNEASLEAGARALALATRLGDPLAIARAQSAFGKALVSIGRGTEGEELLTEALAAARTLGKRRFAGMLLEFLGIARAMRGEIAEGRLLLAEALGIWKALGANRGILINALLQAEAEFRAGEADVALRYAREALSQAPLHGHKNTVAGLLANSAAYLVALGRFDEARTAGLDVLDASNVIDARFWLVNAIQHMAAVAALRPYEDDGRRRDERARAARLFGFVDARLAARDISRGRDDYTEQQEYDRVRAVIHQEFGADNLVQHLAAGAMLTEEQAIGEARAIGDEG